MYNILPVLSESVWEVGMVAHSCNSRYFGRQTLERSDFKANWGIK
jgi:hypothetical protein